MERWQQLEVDRAEIGKQYKDFTDELIQKLRAGAPVQDGLLVIELEKTPRKSPAWKEEFIAKCGQAAADAVYEAAESTDVYTVDVHRRSRFAK